MKKLKLALAAALALAGIEAQAALPFYPNPGTINPASYTFTAANTGNLEAYFAFDGAGFDNLLGLEINGVDSGQLVFPNNVTPPGSYHNFGPVNAGDTLTFYIKVLNTGNFFYSDTSRNGDGINHVYSTAYGGGDFGIPAGTYVGFEDIFGGGDLDYEDLAFVFVNVRAVGGVPEPAQWAMLLTGFGLAGAAMRRRQKVRVTYA